MSVFVYILEYEGYKVCNFKVPFELMGKKLSENQLNDLLEKGKTALIKGIVNPSNQQNIQGSFHLDETFNIGFQVSN